MQKHISLKKVSSIAEAEIERQGKQKNRWIGEKINNQKNKERERDKQHALAHSVLSAWDTFNLLMASLPSLFGCFFLSH